MANLSLVKNEIARQLVEEYRSVLSPQFSFSTKRSREGFLNKSPVGALFTMPIKVLLREKNELRLRFIGEDHTSLQVFRQRLNSTKGVDYANYFPGHPLLEDPEFYIRTTGKTDPEKLLRKLCTNLQTEFNKLSI